MCITSTTIFVKFLVITSSFCWVDNSSCVVSSFIPTTVNYVSRTRSIQRGSISYLALFSKVNDEVEALKAKAAKLRQEAEDASQVSRIRRTTTCSYLIFNIITEEALMMRLHHHHTYTLFSRWNLSSEGARERNHCDNYNSTLYTTW
jgi:hypothetical protein